MAKMHSSIQNLSLVSLMTAFASTSKFYANSSGSYERCIAPAISATDLCTCELLSLFRTTLISSHRHRSTVRRCMPGGLGLGGQGVRLESE